MGVNRPVSNAFSLVNAPIGAGEFSAALAKVLHVVPKLTIRPRLNPIPIGENLSHGSFTNPLTLHRTCN
jgi:hypothetical protein